MNWTEKVYWNEENEVTQDHCGKKIGVEIIQNLQSSYPCSFLKYELWNWIELIWIWTEKVWLDKKNKITQDHGEKRVRPEIIQNLQSIALAWV